MPKSCPDCGSEVEYATASALLLTGTCAGCGHALTVIEPAAPGATGDPPNAEGVEVGSPAAAPVPLALPGGFRCVECGESLEVESATSRQLEVRCTDCDSTFTYVLRRDGESGPEEKEETRRPTWKPERSQGPGPSRARPCRECGAPLRFSTNDEGLVTGECTSCGNRFTLPPRREDGGRGGGRRDSGGFGERRRFERGGPPRGRPFAGGRRPRFGSGAPSFRPRNRWNDDQREGPPRRRRRSDDE